MFYQYCTTFTLPPLKNINKHLFMMKHKVIPFFFIFESPALHKYASASFLSKSCKFLILQFLVKCCKLHSVLKILSNHICQIFFYFQVCTRNIHKNYISFSQSLNSPNLYINWANMRCPDCQNKKLNSRVFIYASNKPLCGTQHRTKLNLRMLVQANKNILYKNQMRIQNMY